MFSARDRTFPVILEGIYLSIFGLGLARMQESGLTTFAAGVN